MRSFAHLRRLGPTPQHPQAAAAAVGEELTCILASVRPKTSVNYHWVLAFIRVKQKQSAKGLGSDQWKKNLLTMREAKGHQTRHCIIQTILSICRLAGLLKCICIIIIPSVH